MKKPVKMKIPEWKKNDIEKGKTVDPNKIITLKKTISFTRNRIIAADAKPETSSTEKDKVVFKVPQTKIPSIQNRDPRLTRNTIQGNQIVREVQNDVVPLIEQANKPPQSALKSHLLNNKNGQRISVKERLGNRPNISSNVSLAPPQILLDNIQSETSFVIPKSTTASNPIVSTTSTSAIHGLNKPNNLNHEQKHITDANQPKIGQQFSKPSTIPTQPLPAFALNPVKKPVVQLKLPSFATGEQQYEPAFTYLFKKTCRYHMIKSCKKEHECPLEHQLPNRNFFCQSINKMSQKSVIDLYNNYMRRNQTLFEFYFPEFCNYFGENKLTDQLIQMVEDCNERKVCFYFLMIIEGLILTGKTFTQALAALITAIKYRNSRTSKEIIKLILNPRNETIEPFVETLHSVAEQDNFNFSVEWMNRLLVMWHEQDIRDLNRTIWDPKIWRVFNRTIVKLIGKDESLLSKLDSDLLTKFVDSNGSDNKQQ